MHDRRSVDLVQVFFRVWNKKLAVSKSGCRHCHDHVIVRCPENATQVGFRPPAIYDLRRRRNPSVDPASVFEELHQLTHSTRLHDSFTSTVHLQIHTRRLLS